MRQRKKDLKETRGGRTSGSFVKNDPRINRDGKLKNHPSSKRLALHIRTASFGGRELVQFHMAVLRGETTNQALDKGGGVIELRATVTERQRSAEWLTSRCFGKVSADPEAEKPGAEDEDEPRGHGMSPEDAERLDEERRNGLAVVPSPPATT